MNLHLDFGPPTIEETPRGRFQVREAIASDNFWRAYKREKFEVLMHHGVTLVQRGRAWVVQVRQPLDGLQASQAPVYALKNTANLLPWQPDHAGHLVAVLDRHGAALDASDTGTGKTYVAAAVARERGLRPLIVAPKVGMRKWADVCKLLGVPFRCVVGWEEAKTKGFPYTALTYSLEDNIVVENGRRVNRPKKKLESIRWKTTRDELLVFDEAHRAKGYITQNARLMAASQGTPTLMISATIADSPRDMYACGRRLGLHHGSNFNDWCQSLFCFQDKTKGWSVVDRQMAAAALHKVLFPEHGSRIRIKDLGDAFPANYVNAELISTDEPEKLNDIYREMLKRVEDLEQQGKTAQVLTERLRYRQAAELHKVAAMLELAEDYAQEGNAVAMFVGFRETLGIIKKQFGRECAVIHGDQTIQEREEERLRFENNEVNYIACMIQAGGVSCDMHDINGKPRVSLISPCDNATMVKQVLGRICRAGALSPARQFILYAAGTVEEKVYENVAAKMAAIDTINDGDVVEPELERLGPAFQEAA